MGDVSGRAHLEQHPIRARLGGLVVATLLVLTGCGGDGAAGAPSPPLTVSPDPAATATFAPESSGESTAVLCQHVATVEERLAALEAVELRLPNRVALDIELGQLQAAFGELLQADLGRFENQLEGPLKRLGYRLTEVELAVEDFRTNSRPQQAVSHVETAATTFGDELSAFGILSRC